MADAQTTEQLRSRSGNGSGNGKPQKKGINYMLTQHRKEIERALPKHMSADRMARIATTEFRRTPQLLECEPKTLFGAIIQASQLGLEPGGALGHAHLVPFWDNKNDTRDVQLIIGYRGMIDLARRSGQIKSLTARAVYEADEFSYSYGLDEHLNHVPSDSDDAGALTHVYAVAHLQGGGTQFEVMPIAKVERIRKGRKKAPADWAQERGPWSTHYAEMAKKTVIRALFKYLPVSVELQRAVALDEQGDAGVSQGHDSVLDLDPDDWSIVGDEPPSDGGAPTAGERGSQSDAEPTEKPGYSGGRADDVGAEAERPPSGGEQAEASQTADMDLE